MDAFTPQQLDCIRKRWPTAGAFYSERDDRTGRAVADVAAYVNTPVDIVVHPSAAESLTVQRIALVAANLTVRWARRVRVVLAGGTDIALAPVLQRDGTCTLGERLQREMMLADPFGEFAVVTRSDPQTRGVALFVGPWTRTPNTDDYVVHAAWWTALAARVGAIAGAVPPAEATVAAAGLAGALGAADLFKRAIGHERDSWMPTFAWDTWSSTCALGLGSWAAAWGRHVPSVVDFRRTLLGGVGAIGSALLYLADLERLRGSLLLLDRDAVDATNLNRSPMFNVLHVVNGMLKTGVASRYLDGRGVQVDVRDGMWREHAASIGADPQDVWISLTNEDGAWAELPFELPPVVLHASTTSEWGFGTGRHIPRLEDCTLCRMPRPTAEFRGPCAEGPANPAGNAPEARASLPFLSTAAAALLLATYMQLGCGAEAAKLPNDVSADLGVGLRAVIALRRGPTPGCRGCRIVQTSAWKQRGGRGAFAGLSGQVPWRSPRGP